VKNKEFGEYSELKTRYMDIPITHYCDRLIVSGFIDTHIHFPQTEIRDEYANKVPTICKIGFDNSAGSSRAESKPYHLVL
jgi:cytosine/adenosine deaminase-related metal-dependent hydrolase